MERMKGKDEKNLSEIHCYCRYTSITN